MDFPGFDIKRTIGKGGMATVYLAIQQSLQREVVLKVVNFAADEADFLERFANEGRIIAQLSHPNIVTIFDIGTTEEFAYISMDYVDGGDLRSRIEEHISPEKALDMVIKIGDALDYAHKKGIVHRDVKPANILFRTDGTPLLSDFGIAKQVAIDNELTSTGTILGSPFYMSPEQAEGIPVDGRTDLYSLGVIFFEMLTGQKPYEGDSAIKVIMQHIQSPIPNLPSELKKFQPLVNETMAKNRDDRVPDAATLVEHALEMQKKLASDTGRRRLATLTATTSFRRGAGAGGTAGISRQLRLSLLTLLVLLPVVGSGFYMFNQSLKSPAVVNPAHRVPVEQTTISETPTNVSPIATAGTDTRAVTGTVSVRDAKRALHWLADNALRDDRLVQPPADNAHYYCSRLLALDPGNQAARECFREIGERFVVLAEKEFSSRNYDKAQTYVTLGLQVDPGNDGLMTLQSLIENRKKTIFETIVDFFRA